MSYSLDSIFAAVIFKTLVQVDLPERGSHQHEINGVSALKDFFGTGQPVSGTINWHYFSDDSEPLQSNGTFKFYDARARSFAITGRTEWRMYYSGDLFISAVPGDLLILARTLNGSIFGLVFQNGSGWHRTAQILFQLQDVTPRLQLITSENLREQELEFAKRQILDELGIEVSIPSAEGDDEIASRELDLALREGRVFPSTRRMAELAQSLVEFDPRDADTTLMTFIDKEERIFRAIEKILVFEKLTEGFLSVDDFINYSLSVHNRRKSRMGFALQNHLSRIFRDNQLIFDAQVITEDGNKPDFIFPGGREYHDNEFNTELLIMLASKSSCKERWRQILDEAEKIPYKHLCTLEQAISESQTRAMAGRNVTLVIPSGFHATYTVAQQRNLWSVNQFIDYVRNLQSQ